MSAKKDMINKQFGDWLVLEEDKEKARYYICKCRQCGKIKSVHGYSLRSGKSTSCGCVTGIGLKDEKGNKYGMLTVDHYLGDKKWLCICECGAQVIAYGKDLRNGDTTSCGTHRYVDLKDKIFGSWKVESYAGDNKWNCICICGTKRVVLGQNLRNGRSTSCGCKSGEKKAESFKETMKIKYGEISSKRIQSPREDWQIKVLDDPEFFKQYILNFIAHNDRKPSIMELSIILDTSYSAIVKKIHNMNLDEYIEFMGCVSFAERQLKDYIYSIYNGTVIENNRSILKNLEIDAYLPDIKLAIEYNGNYWHCDDALDRLYHQHKTLECEKLGIRLVHVFEYEWLDPDKQVKIKNLIYRSINGSTIKLNARQCNIVKPDKNTVEQFLAKYHLQSNSTYSIAYGLTYNNELVGMMTFGRPRFNNNYDWEIIRMSFKDGVSVIGGASKLLEAFKREYHPKNIISYCDRSKFNGYTYSQLGFTKIKLTEPNYVWVNSKNEVLSRYKTTKQALLNQGFGNENMSETEIMKSLHYMRIFDCGNDVYVWHL